MVSLGSQKFPTHSRWRTHYTNSSPHWKWADGSKLVLLQSWRYICMHTWAQLPVYSCEHVEHAQSRPTLLRVRYRTQPSLLCNTWSWVHWYERTRLHCYSTDACKSEQTLDFFHIWHSMFQLDAIWYCSKFRLFKLHDNFWHAEIPETDWAGLDWTLSNTDCCLF